MEGLFLALLLVPVVSAHSGRRRWDFRVYSYVYPGIFRNGEFFLCTGILWNGTSF